MWNVQIDKLRTVLVEAPPPPRLEAWPDETGVVHARPTEVRAGDWWVAPPVWVPAQRVLAPAGGLEHAGHVAVEPTVPLATTGYYSGAWPVHRLAGPRAEAFLSRATRPFVPAVRP